MAEWGPVTTEIAGFVSDDVGVETLAQRICQACVRGFDVDGASLSLFTANAARQMLWATDSTAERIEDLQFGLNEGACIEAATTGYPVLVPDVAEMTEFARWPIFAAAVVEQTRVGALFALPLQWGVVNIGVLDLYRDSPGELDPGQWRDVLGAAEAAATLLLGRRTHPADLAGRAGGSATDGAGADADGWLSQGVFSRPEIHQATGMVMVQLGIRPDEALARMRAHAFSEERMLVDVARDVVARRLSFTEEMR